MCEISQNIKDKMKKFRFRRATDNAGILLKINMKSMELEIEEEFENVEKIDDLIEELPDLQPRYLVYTCRFEREDGRVQYPLCFIFLSPTGASGKQMMAYAGSRNQVRDMTGITKVFEIRDTEDMTEEWLDAKLKFFS